MRQHSWIAGTCIALFATLLWIAATFGAENAQMEEIARDIEKNLIAPCCWTQPVSEHPSEASDRIRREVREMLAAGKSRDEIIDHYVAQYGERILAAPRARGFNRLAYILPWLALVAGAGLTIILVKKFRTPAAATATPARPPAPDAHYASVVEKEMKDLEE